MKNKKNKAPIARVVTASAPITLKLDLACGQSPREGFEGVDIWDGAKHVVDLQKFPWPFKDNSVAELHCSHYAEHVPCDVVRDGNGRPVLFDGKTKDAWFALFDECYRILAPDAFMTVIVPCGRSNRGFQDPTHRRFHVAETFFYLSKDFRVGNKLDHYNVGCNFGIDVQSTVQIEMNAKHSEVQQREFNHYWNTIVDFHAKLKAIK